MYLIPELFYDGSAFFLKNRQNSDLYKDEPESSRENAEMDVDILSATGRYIHREYPPGRGPADLAWLRSYRDLCSLFKFWCSQLQLPKWLKYLSPISENKRRCPFASKQACIPRVPSRKGKS